MKRSSFITTTVLAVLGAILVFCFSGHNYLGYALWLAAAVNVLLCILGKALRRVLILLLCAGLILFVIVEIPIIQNSVEDEGVEADYIIVLGAAVHGDTPSLSLVERMTAAYDYLLEHPDCVAVVSGGQGSNENVSEAEAMYRWLTAKGIAPERIIKEDKSTSTLENLRFSLDMISERGGDTDSIAVVSSEYHIYRAKLIGRTLGLELDGIPAHTSYPSVRLNYFIREAFGVVYQNVLG